MGKGNSLIPHGLTPRQHAQRERWKRHGATPAHLRAARLNLVKARVVLERTNLRRRPTCRRGHKFTAENTRIDPRNGARQCKLCQRLGWISRARTKREGKRLALKLMAARDNMIAAGIRANQHPESAYWRGRFSGAMDAWRRVRAAMRAAHGPSEALQ